MIVIKARIARRGEGVMAPAGVLDHFDHRLEVEAEGLRRQARCGIGAARQRARHRGI